MKYEMRVYHTVGTDIVPNLSKDDVDFKIHDYAEFLYGDYETETGMSAIDDDWKIPTEEFYGWLYDEITVLRCDLVDMCEGDIIDFRGIEIECTDDSYEEN